MAQQLLIVDDDPAIVKFLSAVLSKKGFAVRSASNGQEALDCVAEQPPDLIILDLWMPVMDGRAFIKTYSEFPAPLAPVIIISAGEITLERDVAMRAQGFLAKPFEYDTLLNLIKKLLLIGGS